MTETYVLADQDLASRDGLPADLRHMAARFPRDIWQGHPNLGATARFWLARHDAFRRSGATISQGLLDFQEARIDAAMFGPWLAPRLQHFLTDLNGHHQVEDHHYFPLFMAAESRLVRGFELLEGDHETIHRWIGAVVETANELLRTDVANRDALMRAGDGYAAASGQLIDGLIRHLADEEDLIIPLILDRSEQGLGI